MRNTIRALAFALALQPTLAAAQQFPTVPDHTVIGRIGIGGSSGPSQAIPFASFLPNLTGTQAANLVFVGPASGAVALPSFRLLVGADLPNPGASSKGGVQSLTCSASNWFNTLSTGGVLGCSQPNFTDLAGSLQAAQVPAGLITSTMILDGTILNADINASAAIALSKLATQANNTIVGNVSGSTAVPIALTPGQVGSALCLPQRSVFTTGTNATYTTPTCNGITATRIEFEMAGGGGGGAGSGTTPGAATAGGNTCWNTSSPACTTPLQVANGGALGVTTTGAPAAGGTASGCDLNLSGGTGGPATAQTNRQGGTGGASFFGGQGTPFGEGTATGGPAAANTGSGGSGADNGTTANTGGGGGAGGYCRKMITTPAASYFYTIGAAGAAGTAGTSGFAGGAGATGLIVVTAYWQ